METEKRIVKIVDFDKFGTAIGECENGSQFKCFKMFEGAGVGSFVEGYVMHDEEQDEFYIQAICLSDAEEWKEQEKQYK